MTKRQERIILQFELRRLEENIREVIQLEKMKICVAYLSKLG